MRTCSILRAASLAAVSSLCIVACQTSGGPSVSGGPDAGVDSGLAMSALFSDAEVIAVAQAIDAAEIEQAQFIAQATQNAAVKKLAGRFESDTATTEDTITAFIERTKIVPAQTSLSAALSDEQSTSLNALYNSDGVVLDFTYVSIQVTAHATALGLYDYSLIPSAKNPELRAELVTQRAAVSLHFANAQQLLSTMKDEHPDAAAYDNPPPDDAAAP